MEKQEDVVKYNEEAIKEILPKALFSQHINDAYNLAAVLMRYNFSNTLITCITSLTYKTLKNMQKWGKQFNIKYSKYQSKTVEPCFILNDKRKYCAYTVIMNLYLRFCEDDPNLYIDLNAILKAWTVYTGLNHSYDKGISINDIWYLCQNMHLSQIIDEEADGGRLVYSKEFKLFHYVTNLSLRPINQTKFKPLMTGQEVINILELKKEQGALANTITYEYFDDNKEPKIA